MKGENPLAATTVTSEGQNPQMTMRDTMAGGYRINAGPGGGALRANVQARGLGSVPQLAGVAQIIGLALGSPEFQRR
jgi:hypothetical protein